MKRIFGRPGAFSKDRLDVDEFVIENAMEALALICGTDSGIENYDRIGACYSREDIDNGVLFDDVSAAVDDAIDKINETTFGKRAQYAQILAQRKSNQYVIHIESMLTGY